MKRLPRSLAMVLLVALVVSQAAFLKKCDGNQNQDAFVASLRLALVASPVFIQSLGLGDKAQAVATDFSDLVNDSLDLAAELKACTANPCRVDGVDHFQAKFWDVLRRGHFSLSDKLQRVQSILQGIIDSARVFYGGPSSKALATRSTEKVTEQSLKAQVEELRKTLNP